MSTQEKILARIRNNPRDWRIEGGSHYVFSFPGVEDDVPAHRPIKPVYVRQLVALVDKASNCPAAPHLLCQRPAHVQTSTHRRPLPLICGAAEQLRFRVTAPFSVGGGQFAKAKELHS